MTKAEISQIMNNTYFDYAKKKFYHLEDRDYSNRADNFLTKLFYFTDTYLGIGLFFISIGSILFLLMWQIATKIITNNWCYFIYLLANTYITFYFYLWHLDNKQIVPIKTTLAYHDTTTPNTYFTDNEQKLLSEFGYNLVQAVFNQAKLPPAFTWLKTKQFGLLCYNIKSMTFIHVYLYRKINGSYKIVGIMSFSKSTLKHQFMHKSELLELRKDDKNKTFTPLIDFKAKVISGVSIAFLLLILLLGISQNQIAILIGSLLLIIISFISCYYAFTNALFEKISPCVKLARAKLYLSTTLAKINDMSSR